MRAIRIHGRGSPAEVLRLVEAEEPVPGPDELLVEVQATALNRADLLQCLGGHPAPPGAPADVPGLEYAGVVVKRGARARRFREGDRVMGLVGGGGFGRRLTTHEREAVPIPPSCSFTDAAAIPEAFFTAWDALSQASFRPAATVLIHAVASGVGTAALQLVSTFGGEAIGTSRSEAKLERCRALGLRHGLRVDADPPRFAAEVMSLTAGRGADGVIDLVGGAYLPESIDASAPRGTIVLVGLLAGRSTQVELGKVLQKRLALRGTVLRSRPVEEKIALAQVFEREVLPAFERGALKPVVDSVLGVEQVHEAFARMSSNATVGKIVLEWR